VIQAGATTINLPDTVGYSTPKDIAHFFRTVRAKVNAPGHIVYSAHCHDDLGLAVAKLTILHKKMEDVRDVDASKSFDRCTDLMTPFRSPPTPRRSARCDETPHHAAEQRRPD